jgi:adenylate cyclase
VVKGRTQAVPIHEIVGLKETSREDARECIGLFARDSRLLRARLGRRHRPVQAQRALEPNQPGQTPGVSSNPSLVYTHITEHYKEEPPAEIGTACM